LKSAFFVFGVLKIQQLGAATVAAAACAICFSVGFKTKKNAVL
jgi:hypothetical protein